MTFPAVLIVALASAEVRLQPGQARPGDVVMVEVSGSEKAPSGQLGPAELVFLPFGDRWLALTGLAVEAKPGERALHVVAGEEQIDGALEVLHEQFRRRQLTVSKRFTSISKKDKQHSANDQRAFTAATDRDFETWTFRGDFAWPRNDDVGAPFGDLRLFNGKKKSQHFGTDIDGSTGDPIYAANDGEVVMVRDCFASGNTVLVHHGGRLFTAYFHLSKFEVKEGQQVKRGELLGLVGKTGRVTGPHLHFGVKLDGKWVNAESLLRLSMSPAE